MQTRGDALNLYILLKIINSLFLSWIGFLIIKKLIKTDWKNKLISVKFIIKITFTILKYLSISLLIAILLFGYILWEPFKEYIAANEQGICWAEKRKIPLEEMKLRALKTHILNTKKMFDRMNDMGDGRIRSDFFRIIKHDYDIETILKVGSNFTKTNHGYVDSKEFDEALMIEEFDFRLHQDVLNNDEFYKEIMANNYMLITGDSFGSIGKIFRINTQEMHGRNNSPHVVIPPISILEIAHGTGVYYFNIQSISIDYRRSNYQYIHLYDCSFAVNHCGDSVESIGGQNRKIIKNNGEISSDIIENRNFIVPEYSALTLLDSFVVFLKGV